MMCFTTEKYLNVFLLCFLIFPQKHMLRVLIRSAMEKHMLWILIRSTLEKHVGTH